MCLLIRIINPSSVRALNDLSISSALIFSSKYFSSINITLCNLFKSKLFPGIDIGYKLSDKISINANIGETFRIPTFTDLYYSDPNNQGNENLDPEKAFTSEVGFKLREKNYGISLSLFRRKSDDLIDYVKANPDDKWSPQNIKNVITTGIEFDSKLILNNNILKNNNINCVFMSFFSNQ